MTVCIAAACEQGSKVVVATDRRISYGGVAADSVAAKMTWLGEAGEWLLLYAGEPSNTALIFEEMERSAGTTPITRNNIQQVVRSAYQKRKSIFSSFAALSPYDVTIDTFKTDGLRIFGAPEFGRISQEINQTAGYFREQLLVVGWGKTPHAVTLYEVGPDFDRDHRIVGMAAIGTGQEIALSTMMLLGQSRDRTLAETLYTVASAKFASERSQDEDVGAKTAMFVAWKRRAEDDNDKPPGKFLEGKHVKQLFDLWSRFGRPHISEKAFRPAVEIVHALGMQARVSTQMFNSFLRSAGRKSRRAK
jgi:ATP-dependent protease HslVU (ClpYQ) peptidase subunit